MGAAKRIPLCPDMDSQHSLGRLSTDPHPEPDA